MDQCSRDPYEQQLYKVFDSHDLHNEGSLDKEGLRKLCETLQLQDKSDHLITSLLKDRNITRATFPQFKDALLHLLGNMQSNRSDEKDDREVAPKYVVGSKKYGRRSRPRIDESPNNMSPTNNSSLQRSNSAGDHVKRPLNLPKCNSLPSASTFDASNFLSSSVSDSCMEDMLRAAWRKLGVGEDGYLNQYELILVCEAIGLNKLAESVIGHLSNKSLLEYNPRISFDELLEALRKDETWNEFLGHTTTKENFILDDAKVVQNITLGPDGSGFVNTEAIIELWKNIGIMSPNLLLKDLGFSQNSNISVQELSLVLDKEIKSLSDMRIDYTCNPLVALLQAFIAIYQAEIKSLKTLLQQMCEEKEKLKFDISEANNRSSLLAQEVDENVIKMEQKAQQQFKLLEHRHTEVLRELSDQFASEKELIVLNNSELENKIKVLENEESTLRDKLINVQTYLAVVEGENKDIANKVTELENDKENLEKQLGVIEIEKLKAVEMEVLKCVELEDKIIALQQDNCKLKDKNDEMVSQIESLNKELQILSVKPKNIQSVNNDALSNLEGIGLLGAKRRNGESSVDAILESAIIESPRFGKMRKFHESKDTLDATCLIDDSFNNEIYSHDELLLELQRLFVVSNTDSFNDKYNLVEKLLKNYAIETDSLQDSKQLKTYTNMLELLLSKLLTKDDKCKINKDLIDEQTSADDAHKQKNNEEKRNGKSLEEAYDALVETCADLQQSLDMMKEEYEMCEDYWQKKLEDERSIYEFEQNQNNEKFNEVFARLTEYEEQFMRDSKRLSPIEESANLEKQYTDLELEYQHFRERILLELCEKKTHIDSLTQQLDILNVNTDTCDIGVQVSNLINLGSHMIETTNLYPKETESNDFMMQWPKIDNGKQTIAHFTSLPSTSSNDNVKDDRKSMPIKQKKNRRHVRSLLEPTWNQRRISGESSDSGSEHNLESSKITNNNIVKKLEAGKQRLNKQCQELQMKLHNQKRLYEQLSISYCRLYHSCHAELEHSRSKMDQQFRISTKLQEKLAENDVLIGNLYIENAYLMKNNQRLEQQLSMITNMQVNVEF